MNSEKEYMVFMKQKRCEPINSKEELLGDERENICGMNVICTVP